MISAEEKWCNLCEMHHIDGQHLFVYPIEKIDNDIKESAAISVMWNFPLNIDNLTGEDVKKIIEFVAIKMQKIRNEKTT